MTLNESNYFSTQAAASCMSASQLKSFMDCPARTLAEIRGEYIREKTSALMVGSYVDAALSGTLDQFKAANPDLYTRNGTLRTEYQQAEEIIACIWDDPLMMALSDGRLQEIMTGEIAGVPFRGKLDVLLSAEKCAAICDRWPDMADQLLMAPGAICDWKVMRDMEAVFVPGMGRQSFVEAWKYDLSMAIYQELARQKTGRRFPCFLLVVTKEKAPDKAVIHIPQYMLDAALDRAKEVIPQYQAMKDHPDDAPGCGRCEWCRKEKRLTHAVDADELEGVAI